MAYQSYSEKSTFSSNLIKSPDPSAKMMETHREVMRGKEKAIRWHKEQSDRVTQALERRIQIEKEVRDENFQIAHNQRQAMADQRWQNYENIIKLEDSKRKAYQKNIQDLLNLTKTGAEVWKKFDAGRKKQAAEFARTLWLEDGIGWKKVQGLQSLEDSVWNNEAQLQSELSRLGLDGLSEEKLERLRGIGGYRKVALQHAFARNVAHSHLGYYKSNRFTPVNIPGTDVEITLDAATGDQVDLVLQALDKQRWDEMGETAPTSKSLAGSHSTEILDHARATIHREKSEQASKRSKLNAGKETLDMFNGHLAKLGSEENPGAAIVKTIQMYAGGEDATPESYRLARRRVFSDLTAVAARGDLENVTELLEAGSHEFDHSSGRVTLEKIFADDWKPLLAALREGNKRNLAAAEIGEQAERAADKSMLQEFRILASKGTDGPETWGKLQAQAGKRFGVESESYKFASNQIIRGMRETGDEEGMSIVTGAITRNEHMTPEAVLALGMSPETTATALQLLNKNSTFLPESAGNAETLSTTVDELLNAKIPPTAGIGRQDWTRSIAKLEALRRTRAQYKAASATGMPHDKAIEHAQGFARELIYKDEYFERKVDPLTGIYGFKGAMPTGATAPIELDHTEIVDELSASQEGIYTKPYIDRTALAEKSAALHRGEYKEILSRSVFIESSLRGKIKAIDAEMAQIEYHNKVAAEAGQPLIPQYPDWYVKKVKGSYEKLPSPQALRLLSKYGWSPREFNANTNKAALASGKNIIHQGPLLEKSRNNYANLLGTGMDYNAIEKGSSIESSEVGNIELTNASIRQVIAMMANGKIVSAGRFRFEADTLQRALEITNMSMDVPFSPTNQNILFDAFFKQHGAEMTKEVIEDNRVREAQRQEAIRMHQALTSEHLKKGRNSLYPYVRPEAYQYLSVGEV